MNRSTLGVRALLLMAGIGLGFVAARFTQSDMTMTAGEMPNGAPVVAYWVAPMDPDFRRNTAGKSPMGMDLIPVYEDNTMEAGGSEPSLQINPAVVNNIGVRTAAVERGPLSRQINTVGYVSPNENTLGHIHIRASGWIEELAIKTAGETVAAGDLLFRFYSPDLVNAQAEYLQTRSRGNRNRIKAATDRLAALGITLEQINAIATAGEVQRLVDVRAHHAGTVLQLGVREGKYVDPDDMIMNLADLSSVWVLVDIFESKASWVKPGQTATMRLGFAPGETWEGLVDFVYPTVDADSRTVRARVVFDNADQTLKPNMFANLVIDADTRREALTIPQSALIRASSGDRVILALGDGRFRPAQVVAGIESGDRVQILEGLMVGEQVVTSGQFLIDSEANLDAALLRLTAPTHNGDHP